jgi:hypothetical protein
VAKRGKKRWIQRATARMKRKGTVGSFTRWCKSQGYGSVTSACIAAGLKSKDPKIRKKAGFAKAVKGRKR